MSHVTRAARLLAAPIAAASLFAATSAWAETLKFAHFVPPAHTITRSVVEPFSTGVKDATGGKLDVRVYPGGELGPGPVEQYARAVTGVADIVWGLAGYNSQQFPLSMIVELPGVVEAAGHGYSAMWRAYDKYLTNEFPATVPLALWTSEPNVLIMRTKEIRKPADMAGLKIRVSGAFPAKVIQSLGATPVQMPANEMYNALQTGLIDGIMTGASAILDFKLNEVAEVYIEGASLGNILFFVVMNKAKYDGLPADLKAAVDANSREKLSKSGEEGWLATTAVSMGRLKADPAKKVITLSAEEIAAFNAITIPLRDSVVAELDKQGLPASAVLAAMTGK